MKKIIILIIFILALGTFDLYLFINGWHFRTNPLAIISNKPVVNNPVNTNRAVSFGDDIIYNFGLLYSDVDLNKTLQITPTTGAGNQYNIKSINNGYHVQISLDDFYKTINNTYLTKINLNFNGQIEEINDPNNDGGFGISNDKGYSLHLNLGSEICTPQLQTIGLQFSDTDLDEINYRISNFSYDNIVVENKEVLYHQWTPPDFSTCAPNTKCIFPKVEMPESIKQQCAQNEKIVLFPKYIYQQTISHGVGPDKYYASIGVNPFFYRPQDKEIGIIRSFSFDLIK